MLYLPGAGRAMSEWLDSATEREESHLTVAENGEFIAKMGKAFKITLLIAAVISLGIGIPMTIFLDKTIGLMFVVLGVLAALLLPTLFSYRCLVNKTLLREEYFILFIRIKKEVLWSDVKYRKIRMNDKNSMIKLYGENKKCLISFDGAIVGFYHIVKMAKCSAIKDITKA